MLTVQEMMTMSTTKVVSVAQPQAQVPGVLQILVLSPEQLPELLPHPPCRQKTAVPLNPAPARAAVLPLRQAPARAAALPLRQTPVPILLGPAGMRPKAPLRRPESRRLPGALHFLRRTAGRIPPRLLSEPRPDRICTVSTIRTRASIFIREAPASGTSCARPDGPTRESAGRRLYRRARLYTASTIRTPAIITTR